MVEDFVNFRNASLYLQYHYVSNNEEPVGEKYMLDDPGDGSEYSRFHAKYHPFFRDIIDRTGYRNLYLIEAEKLDIVYSVHKDVDFATSMRDGPHSFSGLAEIAQSVGIFQENVVTVVDFRGYEPAHNDLGAFFLTPIYNGVHHLGALAIQISTDQINEIMTGGEDWASYGMGESGETYILGKDEFDVNAIFPSLRSEARLWVEDPETYVTTLQAADVDPFAIEDVEHFQSTIGKLPAHDEWVDKAIYEGAIGIREKVNYLGDTVLSAYGPLELNGLFWAVFAEKKTSEIMQPVYEQQRRFLISGAILTALIGLIGMILAYFFTAPLKFLTRQAEQINTGDYEDYQQLDAKNEYGRLSQAVHALSMNVQEKDAALVQEREKTQTLMLNILPEPIAERYARGETQLVENVEQTTVLYADILGFAELAQERTEAESADQLKELFAMLDAAADRMDVEIRPLVGANFLATCGLTETKLDHVKRVADFALRLQTIIQQSNQQHQSNLQAQVGVHTGEVTAGIIGDKHIRYDLWGTTVNITNAIQGAAEPGTILVSDDAYSDLEGLYDLTSQSKMKFEDGTEMTLWQLAPLSAAVPQIEAISDGVSAQLTAQEV